MSSNPPRVTPHDDFPSSSSSSYSLLRHPHNHHYLHPIHPSQEILCEPNISPRQAVAPRPMQSDAMNHSPTGFFFSSSSPPLGIRGLPDITLPTITLPLPLTFVSPPSGPQRRRKRAVFYHFRLSFFSFLSFLLPFEMKNIPFLIKACTEVFEGGSWA